MLLTKNCREIEKQIANFETNTARMKDMFLLLLFVLVFPIFAGSYPLRRNVEKMDPGKDSDFLLKRGGRLCNLKEIAKMVFDQFPTQQDSGTGTKDVSTWSNTTFQAQKGVQNGVTSGFCLLIDAGTQTIWCESRAVFLDGPLEGSTVVMAGPSPNDRGTAYFTITGGTSCFAGVTGLVKVDIGVANIPMQFLV